MKPLAAVPPIPDLDAADKWTRWHCPGCGVEMQQPKGIPVALVNTGGPCSDCAEKLRVQAGVPERATALQAAGCPPRYLVPFLDLKSWPKDTAKPQADLAAWDGEPWSLVLYGEVRTGKTMVATELFWRLLSRRKGRGLWIRAGEFINRAFGNFGEESKAEAWRRAYEAPVALFDDLGRGHDGRAWNVMVEVGSHRYDRNLPTLWTTNRKLVAEEGDRERGLAQEDQALYRRLADGLFVPTNGIQW